MALALKLNPRFPPRPPRVAVAIETSLILGDDRLLPIVIRNLSDRGFMADALSTLEPGTPFGVVIPGCGIVRGTIRWTEGGEVGAYFKKPLDADKLARFSAGDSQYCDFLTPDPLPNRAP